MPSIAFETRCKRPFCCVNINISIFTAWKWRFRLPRAGNPQHLVPGNMTNRFSIYGEVILSFLGSSPSVKCKSVQQKLSSPRLRQGPEMTSLLSDFNGRKLLNTLLTFTALILHYSFYSLHFHGHVTAEFSLFSKLILKLQLINITLLLLIKRNQRLCSTFVHPNLPCQNGSWRKKISSISSYAIVFLPIQVWKHIFHNCFNVRGYLPSNELSLNLHYPSDETAL